MIFQTVYVIVEENVFIKQFSRKYFLYEIIKV